MFVSGTLCVFLQQRVDAEGPGPGAERRLLLGGGRRRRCALSLMIGQGHHAGKGGSLALSVSGAAAETRLTHAVQTLFCYWSAAGSSLGWRSSQCVVLTEAGLGRN